MPGTAARVMLEKQLKEFTVISTWGRLECGKMQGEDTVGNEPGWVGGPHRKALLCTARSWSFIVEAIWSH